MSSVDVAAPAAPALPCIGCGTVKDFASDQVGQAAGSLAGDALQRFASAVKEEAGRAAAEVGTAWTRVPTIDPLASDGGAAPSVAAGQTPGTAGTAGIVEVLSYASWITLAVCVLSLIVAGARMGIESRRNDGEYHVTRLMSILIAAILVSASSALVTQLMPDDSYGESTVAFLQNSLWFYTAAGVVISIIIGALRMAWEQRADAGRDLVKSLLTFVAVSGAGLMVISLLLNAGDAFSAWILSSSLDCNVGKDSACFGENLVLLLGMASASGLGVVAVIVLGLVAFVAGVVQVAMMIARSGMLILLAGSLPLAASATNTTTGRQMFQKLTGWIIALLLYKPAAAIIYATGFQLVGTDVFGAGLKDLGKVVVGLMMMILAVFALPALMRLVTPAVGALASGNAAGNMAMGAAAALPTGAIAGGQLAGGGSRVAEMGASGTGSTGGPSGSGPDSGSGGSSPDSGSGGSDSSGGGGSSSSTGQGKAPSGAAEGGSGGGTASGDDSGAGGSDAAGGAESGGAEAASSGGAGAGAGAGASGAGAGAGGAAAGGGAAAAAAGPAGLAAGAAASSGSSGEGAGGSTIGSAASGAVQGAASGASEMGQEAAGESDDTGEGGPSGSR